MWTKQDGVKVYTAYKLLDIDNYVQYTILYHLHAIIVSLSNMALSTTSI